MKKKNLYVIGGSGLIGSSFINSLSSSEYNIFNLDIKNNVKKNKSFFIKKRGQYFFDLRGYLLSQLKLSKISKIDIIKIDTFNSKNNFFSARRSLKLKHNDYGRNISIIMIN